MNIPRDKIIDVLRARGQEHQVEEATAELPKRVDTRDDQGLLAKYKVTIRDLVRL